MKTNLKVIFLLSFSCCNHFFAQEENSGLQEEVKLRAAPEALVSYTQPKFSAGNNHRLSANDFWSQNLGLMIYNRNIGSGSLERKHCFGFCIGVNLMKYTVNDELYGYTGSGGKYYPPSHFYVTTTSYSTGSVSYTFSSVQLYFQLRYTRFIRNFFFSLQGGPAYIFYNEQPRIAITEYTTQTGSYPMQDSQGNWYWVPTNDTSTKTLLVDSYMGSARINFQAGLHLGYKIKRFMIFAGYELDLNSYYKYKRVGAGLTFLLEDLLYKK